MEDEKIQKIIDEIWDKDFLNTLQEYSMKINEHDLIGKIKMAIAEGKFLNEERDNEI